MGLKSIKMLVLVIVPIFVYLLPLPFMPLMEPDEGRYSSIPNEMNISGDYVTPRLKGVVYFEKPPLAYWATALSFKVFGKNEFSARLFVALAAWGCIILAYRMGLFFHDARTGLYAAAVLTTFLYHSALGRINILDMPLAFFLGVAIWSGFRFFASAEKRKVWLYLLYLFSALAFLTKGLIGIVFPFGIIGVWLLFSRRFRDILRLVSPLGILLFAAVSLPWLILVQRENPDFFRFFFIQEHFLRYTTKIHDHYQPLYYYLPILLAGTLPWIFYLPEAIKGVKGGEPLFKRGEKSFLLVWAGLIFVFFSLSSSKLVPYLTPLFPPLAVGFGVIFRRFEKSQEDTVDPVAGGWRLAGIIMPLLFLTALFVPLFLSKHSVNPSTWLALIAIPAFIQLVLLFLPFRIRTKGGRGWFLTIYLLYALFFVSLTAPLSHYLAPYKSARQLSAAIESNIPRDAEVYQYGISLYGVDFYTGRKTPIVDDIGELGYGVLQLPKEKRDHYFLHSEAFFKKAKNTKGLYCATENDEKLARLKKEFPESRILWQSAEYSLLQLNGSTPKEN
ncbi:MAG: glycosyltransferase family 39 protein [Syntrophales bacterium]